MAAAHPTPRVYAIVFVLLLVLLALTVGAAQVDLGRWNFLVATLIASAKALLIILYFMHVRYAARLTWVAAAAGFVWLAILLALTFSDYLTRDWTVFS